jgi:A/G-specific adenine glycosylase
MTESHACDFSTRLLAWYAENGRDLPWRRTRDPYRIWVAEVMLQQTQVTTVIPYYARFLTHFPTVRALAEAPLDDVLKVWEGLGYYARARHLHAAARQVLEDYGGQIPVTRDVLLSLPGIGRYTAGAVLSIAFGQDVPALDGNVRRVFSRLFAIDKDVTRGAGKRELEHLTVSMLPSGRAGDWNQALMDLGATVCTARAPLCEECPLSEQCEAHRLGREEDFPVARRRAPTPHYEVTAGVVWNGDGRFLIAQRPPDGLLGGLWEFPGGKRETDESLEDCLKRELTEELAIEVRVIAPLVVVQHAYTHFRITLHAFHCRWMEGEPQSLGCAAWTWITLEEVGHFAFSAADHKIIAALWNARASI